MIAAAPPHSTCQRRGILGDTGRRDYDTKRAGESTAAAASAIGLSWAPWMRWYHFAHKYNYCLVSDVNIKLYLEVIIFPVTLASHTSTRHRNTATYRSRSWSAKSERRVFFQEHSNPASAWWVESWSTISMQGRRPKFGGNRPAKHMAVYEKTKMEKILRRAYTRCIIYPQLSARARTMCLIFPRRGTRFQGGAGVGGTQAWDSCYSTASIL